MRRLRPFPAVFLLPLVAVGCRSNPAAPGESPGDPDAVTGPAPERLGYEVAWDGITEQADVTGASGRLVVGLGSRTALVESQAVDLSQPVGMAAGRLQLAEAMQKQSLARPARPTAAASPTLPRQAAGRPLVSAPAPAAVRPPAATSRGGVLVLDAGHGGKDPGCSHGKTHEKEIVLDVCRRAVPYLEAAGFTVHQTRATDEFIPLDDRVALVGRTSADLFVSVHANANDRTDLSGFEVYHKTNGAAAESRALAQAIEGAFREVASNPDRGLKGDPRGLRVLKSNTVPAALVEIGFVTNPDDRSLLLDASYRERLARALATGIERYRSR